MDFPRAKFLGGIFRNHHGRIYVSAVPHFVTSPRTYKSGLRDGMSSVFYFFLFQETYISTAPNGKVLETWKHYFTIFQKIPKTNL